MAIIASTSVTHKLIHMRGVVARLNKRVSSKLYATSRLHFGFNVNAMTSIAPHH